MASSFERDLCDAVGAYLAGERSLQEFQEWFVPRAWDMDVADVSTAAEVASGLELLLAEFSSGHWSEEELKVKMTEQWLRISGTLRRVDLIRTPGLERWLQRSTSSTLGRQPLHATRYFQVGRAA